MNPNHRVQVALFLPSVLRVGRRSNPPAFVETGENTSNHAGADPESGSLGRVEDPKSRVVVQQDHLR